MSGKKIGTESGEEVLREVIRLLAQINLRICECANLRMRKV